MISCNDGLLKTREVQIRIISIRDACSTADIFSDINLFGTLFWNTFWYTSFGTLFVTSYIKFDILEVPSFSASTIGSVVNFVSHANSSVIDKSLDLEKISRRNYSCFSLSSWRIVFSFLFLFSIFKIFRQQIFFLSRFARFLKSILFLFSIFKIVKTKVSFYSRFMRLCSLFLFLFL